METLLETSEPAARTGRGRSPGSAATYFKPGHPGRAKGTVRKPRQASRLLRDMRRVYDQDASHDRTQGQRALRKLFEENPKEFIAQLARLERSHQAGIAKGLAAPPQLGPISPEPVEELCRRLLTEALAAAKQ